MNSRRKPPTASRRFEGLQAGDDANLDEADALLRQSGDLLPDLPPFDDRNEPVWGKSPPLEEEIPLLTDVVQGPLAVAGRFSEPSFPKRPSRIPETEHPPSGRRMGRDPGHEPTTSRIGRLDFDSLLSTPSPSLSRNEGLLTALHGVSQGQGRRDPGQGHASLSTDFLIDDPRFETPYRSHDKTSAPLPKTSPPQSTGSRPAQSRASVIPSSPLAAHTMASDTPKTPKAAQPTKAPPRSTSSLGGSSLPPPPPSAFSAVAGLSEEQKAVLEMEISRLISDWVDHTIPALLQKEMTLLGARIRTEALAQFHATLAPRIAQHLDGFVKGKSHSA
jgi:hypothetical protein